eukprot:TRINITY_DN9467_c0_g1_i2.p1 TRINITY_DN9467_c0_g1~~TRINITY_DN9467_c0_g1_i2.p1  ORF type:complete len:290 (-),score=44.96 TRINITY_DN9467_c0_g1_i2:493-1362(-)
MARLAMGAADGMALQAVLDSFVQFAIAPAVARRCVYAVVCNTMPNDLEEFRSAFSYADRDADGLVSRTDLSAALSWAQAINLVDPDLLFAAADVNSSGLLDFRKFSAACLYSRLAPLDEWLAQQAFVSLDHDVDGRLTPHDVMAAFGFLPVGLPQHGDFGVQQWTSCVLGMVPGSGAEFADLSAVNNEFEPLGDLKHCSVDLTETGLFASCITDSQRLRAGKYEAAGGDFNEAAWVRLPPDEDEQPASAAWQYHPTGNCGRQWTMADRFHTPGVGLSSPSYVPMHGWHH